MEGDSIYLDLDDLTVQLISDAHLEMRKRSVPLEPSASVIILAGDIGSSSRKEYFKFLNTLSTLFNWVLVVSGNHEYYNASCMEDVEKEIRSLCSLLPNVTYLQNQLFTVKWRKGKVDIFGATLWTETEHVKEKVSREMNDYKKIFSERGKKITPIETSLIHRVTVREIVRAREKSENMIVVTHHLPSFQCLHEAFRTPEYEASNHAYASNLEHLLGAPISLWLFGHSHRRMDMHINGTRVISNPLGYPGEHTGYDPSLVIRM